MSTAKKIDFKNKTNTPELANKLNDSLTNLFACRLKSQVYHWNFKGSRFYGVHKTLEDVYVQFDDAIDDVAERITTLGGTTFSTFNEIVERTEIKNQKKDTKFTPDEMITDMANSLIQLNAVLKEQIKLASESYDDPVTEDLLISILAKSEKFRWMLESLETNKKSA